MEPWATCNENIRKNNIKLKYQALSERWKIGNKVMDAYMVFSEWEGKDSDELYILKKNMVSIY